MAISVLFCIHEHIANLKCTLSGCWNCRNSLCEIPWWIGERERKILINNKKRTAISEWSQGFFCVKHRWYMEHVFINIKNNERVIENYYFSSGWKLKWHLKVLNNILMKKIKCNFGFTWAPLIWEYEAGITWKALEKVFFTINTVKRCDELRKREPLVLLKLTRTILSRRSWSTEALFRFV